MLVSPLFLIVYFAVFICGYFTYIEYERKYYFADEERIERITGVRFPDFEIVEYNQGRGRFVGEYIDECQIEFEDSLSDDLYHSLDSLVTASNTGWRMKGDAYVFSATWGNGLPAPKGENDDEDRTFSISFEKGSKQAVIRNGMW